MIEGLNQAHGIKVAVAAGTFFHNAVPRIAGVPWQHPRDCLTVACQARENGLPAAPKGLAATAPWHLPRAAWAPWHCGAPKDYLPAQREHYASASLCPQCPLRLCATAPPVCVPVCPRPSVPVPSSPSSIPGQDAGRECTSVPASCPLPAPFILSSPGEWA